MEKLQENVSGERNHTVVLFFDILPDGNGKVLNGYEKEGHTFGKGMFSTDV